MMKAHAALCLGFMLLAGCGEKPDIQKEDALLHQIYEKGSRNAEGPALASTAGRAMRKGDDLILALGNGQKVSFHSNCPPDSGSSCDGYALIAYLPSVHLFVVLEYFYEDAEYWLINDQTGRKTNIRSVPIFSPDRERFLVQDDDMINDHPNNLEIWRRVDDGAVLEWAHPYTLIDQEIPGFKGLYHTDADWHEADRIALNFSADYGATKWLGSITREKGGWHVSGNWPKEPNPI